MKNNRTIIAVVAGLAVLIAAVGVAYIIKNSNGGFEEKPEVTGNETVDQNSDDDKPDTDPVNTDQVLTDLPELKLISSEEVENWVIVETTYGKFRYPYAFTDIIGVNVLNQGIAAQLQFLANIDGNDAVLYTIHYNNPIGSPFGTLKLDHVGEVEVSVEFGDVPESVSSDWENTFYAAQDTFNDVRVFMMEDARFVAVD